jgi:hypothetical protein
MSETKCIEVYLCLLCSARNRRVIFYGEPVCPAPPVCPACSASGDKVLKQSLKHFIVEYEGGLIESLGKSYRLACDESRDFFGDKVKGESLANRTTSATCPSCIEAIKANNYQSHGEPIE